MLVMAVSGLLVVVALVGQHQLQAQARFDSAINKTLQNITVARNAEFTNNNESGGGNDTNTLTAGDAFEMDNAHLSHSPKLPLEEIETLYANPDANNNPDLSTLIDCPPDLLSGGNCACPASLHPDDSSECQEQFQEVPDALTMTSATHAAIYYVNTGKGLKICQDVSSGAWLSVKGACATGITANVIISLKDTSGFTARIQIDGTTGYARRL
jgi:hypothetical protein